MGDLKFVISQYASQIWRYRWTVIGTAWLMGLLGAVLVMTIPDKFRSRAQIFVDQEALLIQIVGRDGGNFDTQRQVENVRQLMFARPNLEDVLKKTDIDLQADTDIEREELLQELTDNLILETVGADVYKIEYVNDNPQEAQDVVQAVLNSFIEKNLSLKRSGGDETVVFLKGEIKRLQNDLRDSEQKLAEFRSRYPDELVKPDAILRRLRDTESFIEQAQVERSLLEARLDQLQLRLAGTPKTKTIGIGGGFSGPTSAQQRLQDLLVNRDTLRQQYTDSHPDVIAIERLIVQARKDARGGGRTGGGRSIVQENVVYDQLQEQINNVDLQLNQINARAEISQRTVNELRDILERQPAIQQELALMETTYKQVFSDLKQRETDLKNVDVIISVGEKTNLIDFKTIEPPIVPIRPIGPNRLLLFLGVLFASLAAGVGVAFLRIQLSDTFPTLAHLREIFDLPILGSVSQVAMSGQRAVSFIRNFAWAGAMVSLFLMFGGLIYVYHVLIIRPDFTRYADQLYFMFRSII